MKYTRSRVAIAVVALCSVSNIGWADSGVVVNGGGTSATGYAALAVGANANASGNQGIAIGANTVASGGNATAIGLNTKATAIDAMRA